MNVNNNKNKTSAILNEYLGKQPPQSIKVERALIGALIDNGKKTDEVIELLPTEDYFYDEKCKIVFKAILSTNLKGFDVNLTTISDELERSQKIDVIGGYYELVKINQDFQLESSIESYCRIIIEYYMKRELIRTSSNTIQQLYSNDDIFDVLTNTSSEIDKLALGNIVKPFQSSTEVMNDYITNLAYKLENKTDGNAILGSRTGFSDMDYYLNGLNPTRVYILAARPAMGKTTLALNMCLNTAKNGNGVGFFSLEMPENALVEKMVSDDANVLMNTIKSTYSLTQEQVTSIYESAQRLKSLNIHYDTCGYLNLRELESKIRVMVNKHKIKGIFIDYLQLMTSGEKHNNRENEISTISRGLKKLAMKYNIWIVALSQLSRAVEIRTDKRPMLSDLRESGAIEQDANCVMFMYRDSYYNKENQDLRDTEVIIAKNREGEVATINLDAYLEYQRFANKGIENTEDIFPTDSYNYEQNKIFNNLNNNNDIAPF